MTELIEDADAFVEQLNTLPFGEALRLVIQAMYYSPHWKANGMLLFGHTAFREWCATHRDEMGAEEDT